MCIYLSVKRVRVLVVLLSHFENQVIPWNRLEDVSARSVSQLCPTLVTPLDYRHQAPLSMEFSRQEYWNGLPFLPPEDRLHPGIEPISLESPALQVDFLLLSHSEAKSRRHIFFKKKKKPFSYSFLKLQRRAWEPWNLVTSKKQVLKNWVSP